MRFSRDMAALIKAQRKTQARRPVRRHPEFGFEIPCPYKPGHRYRVQVEQRWSAKALREHERVSAAEQPTRARAVLAYLDGPLDATTGRSTGEITVTAVRRERLGEIGKEDARREGFRFLPEFEAWWSRRYRGFDPDAAVWVVSFTAGDDRDRFDQPRLLARSPGRELRPDESADAHQDYVTEPRLAMAGSSDPGEAVDAKSAERFAAEGYAGHARRKQVEVRRQHTRSLAIRLKDAERRKDGEAIKALIPELQSLAAQLGAAA